MYCKAQAHGQEVKSNVKDPLLSFSGAIECFASAYSSPGTTSYCEPPGCMVYLETYRGQLSYNQSISSVDLSSRVGAKYSIYANYSADITGLCSQTCFVILAPSFFAFVVPTVLVGSQRMVRTSPW